MAISLNLALLADTAHIDDRAKFYIIGEFRFIFAPKVPLQYGRFVIVARWFADLIEVQGQENTLGVEIIDEDGKVLVARAQLSGPIQFGLIGAAEHGKAQAQAIIAMSGLSLPKYGTYDIGFWVNGQYTGKITFHVVEIPKQQSEPDVTE